MSASPSPAPSSSKPGTPVPRHATSATDKQRAQLERLLKDPAKPAYIPATPKEKTIRPPREMMKNVQGSSAGAGSGEFHVYKASRRREYERIKMLEDEAQKVCTVRCLPPRSSCFLCIGLWVIADKISTGGDCGRV
jgi:hypothetical protein